MNAVLKKFLSAGLALAAVVLASPAQTGVGLGNLPLWFEAGSGDAAGRFTAHGRNAEFSISPAGAGFIMRQADGQAAAVDLKFVGGTLSPKVSGESLLSGKINYFTGSDPSAWQSGVRTFGSVRMDDVYPGVNAVFYGNGQKLEYDLDLAAGVDADTVRIRYDGAEKLTVDPQGELVIGVNGGDMVQHPPVAYQVAAGGVRHDISASYKLLDAHTVEFALGDYDHSLPLAIDPILGYSTYFGGNFGDIGWAIALDAATNIYIAGETLSTQISNNIPFTTNAIFPNFNGGKFNGDAFVAEFDSSGTNLVYCTYLGGSDDDAAFALAVDPAGHAYVAGGTDSTNFPVKNAVTMTGYSGSNISGVFYQPAHLFPGDAFVAELDINGAQLLYSTYLGGEAPETAYGIAIDGAGDAFVTGKTFSTNFPVTTGAFQTTLKCTNSFDVNANAFLSEIAPGGHTLVYSTYLGGTNFDAGTALSYNNGFLYMAGFTASTNFPLTNGLSGNLILNNFTNQTHQRSDRAHDAFVTLFNTTLGTNLGLIYSTYLGSTNDEAATGIIGDSSGTAYVVGWTTSTNFPTTPTNLANYSGLLQLGSYVRTNPTVLVLATNAFLTQISLTSSNTAALGFSQIFGGFGIDRANGVAMDGAGDIFVVGSASSRSNYPTTGNLFGSLRSTNSSRVFRGRSQSEAVVTAFQAGFSNLLYSAYLGGRDNDYGNGIAVDGDGNAYITGQTMSTNFPTVTNYLAGGQSFGRSFRAGLDGTNDAFVSRIILNATVPPLFITVKGTNGIVGWVPFSSETTPELLTVESITNLSRSFTFSNAVVTAHTNGVNITYKTNFIVFPEQWQLLAMTNTIYTNGMYKLKFDATNQMQYFRFLPN